MVLINSTSMFILKTDKRMETAKRALAAVARRKPTKRWRSKRKNARRSKGMEQIVSNLTNMPNDAKTRIDESPKKVI